MYVHAYSGCEIPTYLDVTYSMILTDIISHFSCGQELTAVSEDIRRLKRQNQESELELAAYDYKISATRLDMDRMQGLKRQAEAELNAVKQDVAAKLRQVSH